MKILYKTDFFQRAIEFLLALNIGVLGMYVLSEAFSFTRPFVGVPLEVWNLGVGTFFGTVSMLSIYGIIKNNITWRMHTLIFLVTVFMFSSVLSMAQFGFSNPFWVPPLMAMFISLSLRLNLWLRFGEPNEQ